MAENSGFTFSIKYLIAGIIIAALAVIVFIYLTSPKPPEPPPKTNQDIFLENLQKSERVTIIMNITDVNSSGISSVFNCGTELAYSLALLGKDPQNFSAYVFNQSTCVGLTNVSRPVTECLAEAKESSTFFINYGDLGTIFRENSAYVYINETFILECKVEKRN
ncbi:hypothetical protein HY570_03215 [Candidatus Micrarchaeota archaeon]|nr:hypothetical protein [Candidatus Micrarchaeota archaeon]